MKQLKIIGFVWLVTCAALVSAGSGPEPVVDSAYDCKVNYMGASQARHTCNHESFHRVDDATARVAASCETKRPQEYQNTEITLNSTQCGQISNCNGVYTRGPCLECTDKKTMRKVAC